MKVVRRNLLVAATGPTGCGKSRALYALFAKRTPRLVIFDSEHEARERDPSVVSEEGFDGFVSALRFCYKRARSWHIALRLTLADKEKVLELLSPLEGSSAPSLSRALGGVAILCDELDTLAPKSAGEIVLGCWKRGRHDLLSIYGATQRPAEVSRVVTSQSHIVIFFATYEPADIEFCRASRGPNVAAALRRLAPFHSLYHERGKPNALELDPFYHIVREVPLSAPLTLYGGKREASKAG